MESVSDSIFERYGKLADQQGITVLPEPAKTLMAIYTAHGIICNGGFAYFFEMDFNGENAYEVIMESYRNIGLPEYAAAIQKVLNLFPDGKPHENKKERTRFIYRFMSGDDEKRFSPLVGEAEALFFRDSSVVYEKTDSFAINYK